MTKVSREYLREKAKYIADAKKRPFLDAVFLMNYYNHEAKRWGPGEKPADIAPEEVFDAFDAAAYADALKRARKLLDDNTEVGMAYFRYPSVKLSYEEAVKKFKGANPGFSEDSYGIAIGAGVTAMR